MGGFDCSARYEYSIQEPPRADHAARWKDLTLAGRRLTQDGELGAGGKGCAQLNQAGGSAQGDAHRMPVPLPINGATGKREARHSH